MVEDKFKINLQGKEFILFEGLLDEFHKNGGRSIKTTIINFKFNQLGIQHSIIRTGLCFYANQYIYDICKYYYYLNQ